MSNFFYRNQFESGGRAGREMRDINTKDEERDKLDSNEKHDSSGKH